MSFCDYFNFFTSVNIPSVEKFKFYKISSKDEGFKDSINVVVKLERNVDIISCLIHKDTLCLIKNA